jgi:hypothetical protein
MTDYTTIRVSQDAKAAAQEAKREQETWNDYIQRCTDEPPVVREFVDADDLLEGQSVSKGASIDYGEIQTRVEKAVRKVLQ